MLFRSAAYQAVVSKTEEFLALTQGGAQGVPNVAGTQMPLEGGLPSLGPGGGAEGGPLGSPIGEANGPVQ